MPKVYLRSALIYSVTAVMITHLAVSQVQFTSNYRSKHVTGVAGLSVNFTWTFRGNLSEAQLWKVKSDGSSEIMISVFNTMKVKISRPYVGRISAVWNGSSPGQITFMLNLTRVRDKGYYSCKLLPEDILDPTSYENVLLVVLDKPGPPIMRSSDEGIHGNSLTVRWTAPADDGGSPITGYHVVMLKGDTEINNINITDPGTTRYTFGGLERDTNYAVKVFARNAVFEGDPVVAKVKTKFEGPPAEVELYDLPSETTDHTITLKWKEPKDYGKVIIQYTVYQRIVTDEKLGTWTVVGKITDVSIKEMIVKLERGKVYEFVITATNELGESLKEETKIKRVKVVDLQNNDKKVLEECNCSCHYVMLIAIIGVLVFIILVLFIYIVWLHKKGARRKLREYKDESAYEGDVELKDLELGHPDSSDFAQPSAEYMDIKETTTDESQTQTVGQAADYAPLHPSTRSWEVSRDHVTIEKIIGKGAFGQVAKGTAAELRGRPGMTTIAIKMLKEDASDSDKRDLVRELETMKRLKPHPHVIKLLGCVTETEPLLVLIEYISFGDLLGYLRKSRGLNDTYFKDPDIKPQTNLTSQQLIKFAWQIADGMSYLSSKSIIHRDLAARNVLVGKNETCKVTDFGMARDVQQESIYERKTKGRLPVKWTAYEALMYGTYTTKSDVWSYGVLLYEIFTIGGSPYPRMDGRKIAKLLQQNYRMPKPRHVDDILYQIMIRCWQNDPETRPTFTELRNQLKEMETQHKRLINMKMYDKQLYANVEDLNV
ncbi:tyrosine-protein kinase receptor Tie-1-like isoform X2 [Stylophora pistillata]|uniref:tyrosine-protein kinase receptor Tie-1-like isoform X2 n=1 Tax=Stylophora pistillata TaxID=50429 RepID=UPI000C044D99|nr:tyrosine-protein kinase receptor Tie-1-like isoform X2 [Stylophora pistillata]